MTASVLSSLHLCTESAKAHQGEPAPPPLLESGGLDAAGFAARQTLFIYWSPELKRIGKKVQ